jgi:hypothetical protein
MIFHKSNGPSTTLVGPCRPLCLGASCPEHGGAQQPLGAAKTIILSRVRCACGLVSGIGAVIRDLDNNAVACGQHLPHLLCREELRRTYTPLVPAPAG